MHQSSYVQKSLFLSGPLCPLVLGISLPPPTQYSMVMGKESDTDVPFMAGHFSGSYSLHLGQLQVFLLTTLLSGEV